MALDGWQRKAGNVDIRYFPGILDPIRQGSQTAAQDQGGLRKGACLHGLQGSHPLANQLGRFRYRHVFAIVPTHHYPSVRQYA